MSVYFQFHEFKKLIQLFIKFIFASAPDVIQLDFYAEAYGRNSRAHENCVQQQRVQAGSQVRAFRDCSSFKAAS